MGAAIIATTDLSARLVPPMLGRSVRIADLRNRLKDRWNELDESQRSLRRMLAAVVLLALLGTIGWFVGRPLWEGWQRRRALAQVQVFSQRNDYRNAALALQRAIAVAPNDPATWQEAARLLGEIGSPEAIVAREQLTRLEPTNLGAKLALAADALRFDRPDLAQSTLAELDTAARRDEAFFRLAATLALALGRTDEVEANLAKLVAASPGDSAARFDYAAVRLWSVDETKREAARRELEGLLDDSKVRVRAAVELLKDAARQADQRRIEAVTNLLQRHFVPRRPANLSGTSMAGWSNLLEHLKEAAAHDGPAATAVLAGWLGEIGQRREALLWLEGLPRELGEALDVRDVAAQLSAEAGDLDRVDDLLRGGAWGVWPRDVLTLAIASRLQRLRYDDAHGRATWADAVAAAGDSGAGLRALVRLATAWGEPDATESALQALIERSPSNVWAFTALETIYAARRDLSKLWDLHERWVRQMPTDDQVAERWIVLGCILNHVSPELAARAEHIYANGNGDAPTAIALAAVRWRQGRARDAVSLIAALPQEERERPGAALWLGLARADLGDKVLAQQNLRTAWGAGLSSAEADLIRGAAAKVGLELQRR